MGIKLRDIEAMIRSWILREEKKKEETEELSPKGQRVDCSVVHESDKEEKTKEEEKKP